MARKAGALDLGVCCAAGPVQRLPFGEQQRGLDLLGFPGPRPGLLRRHNWDSGAGTARRRVLVGARVRVGEPAREGRIVLRAEIQPCLRPWATPGMAVDLTRDPNLLELWQIRILLKPTAIGRQGHEPGDPGPVELAHGFIERIGPGSNHRKVPLRDGVLYDVGLMLSRAERSAPLAAAWSWGRPGARRRGRPADGRSCS
jgi:hypothetical protein